ncbi:MAG: 2Fe-2S iron-sulfur cluster-binding protein [Candidatus Methanofastidiosia archaeon]|jgi:heterodisulfide reductase subunit A
MPEEISLTIDGEKISAIKGEPLLKVANHAGIDIPSLCYHEALEPYGACRLCMVEIEDNGQKKLHTSCTYKVKEGITVYTQSDPVVKTRSIILELLLARCPDNEYIKELAQKYQVKNTRFNHRFNGEENCILCGLCVRICKERMGKGTIGFAQRGVNREVVLPFDKSSEYCLVCGSCISVCPTNAVEEKNIFGKEPIKIFSEFELGLAGRHPVYVPFPQAVPNVPVIDPEVCVHHLTGECKICEAFCEADAIDYDQEEEIVELDAGAIVVATGFDLFDPAEKPEYGYNGENVITGLEFERLVNASGPTGGKIKVNGKYPENVVFIQCVGSRDKDGHEYCSRVCCMYTAKQAHLIREKIPGADLTVYYTDMRAFGKGFEEFYNRVQKEGVNYRRRDLDDEIKVEPNEDHVLVQAKGFPDIKADLVVLATAVIPRKDTSEMSHVLNINQSADGFFLEAHPKLRPVDTFTDGIFLAGCCQSPKDIPDTVAQASGAASRVSDILSKTVLQIEATTAQVNEALCRGCGFCVEVCPYEAITLKEIEPAVFVAEVNEAVCKGCGACSAACLSEAVQQKGFTDEQILATIKALSISQYMPVQEGGP